MTEYKEINVHGLAQYHLDKLCYPYTSTPAFKFWESPMIGPLPEVYCRMRTWQDGRCGLCGFRGQLVEDHCHDTGKVRGMICKSCNTTEGRGNGHNMDQWRNGVTVAAQLGIDELYVDIFGNTPMRDKEVSDAELDELGRMLETTSDEYEARVEEHNRLVDKINAQRDRDEAKRRIASAVMWF